MSGPSRGLAAQAVRRPPTPDVAVHRRGQAVSQPSSDVAHGLTGSVVRDRRVADPVGPDRAAAIVQHALRGPGHALDGATREFMERRLGADLSAIPVRVPAASIPGGPLTIARADDPSESAADRAADRALDPKRPIGVRLTDFSGIRIHTGPAATAAVRALRAHAFTAGENIVFGDGEYRPDRPAGRRLLAHELAHATQRRGGAVLFRKEVSDKEEVALQGPRGVPPDDEQEVTPATTGPGPAAPVPVTSGPRAPDGKAAMAALPKPAPGPSREDDREADRGKTDDPSVGVVDLATGDLSLIDEELAEHERWAAAEAVVGEAGSARRASFIAEEAGSGAAKGLKEGTLAGLEMGVGMKIAEKVVEKTAVTISVRLGAQAARFTPLPGVGAVIGGVMAGYDLAKRDWGATGRTIGAFGQGSDVYEQLANSIESISAVLEIANQVANVIAGVLGAITVYMWIVAVATAGTMSVVAAPLTAAAAAIGIGTMVLDGINSIVLKQLVSTFRALHAFASDADPRDVVTQGDAIASAAGAATGFVGGLAGGLSAGAATEKGLHFAGEKLGPKAPPHPTPPAATGEGPIVKAEPAPREPAGSPRAAPPEAEAAAAPGPEAPAAATPGPTSGAATAEALVSAGASAPASSRAPAAGEPTAPAAGAPGPRTLEVTAEPAVTPAETASATPERVQATPTEAAPAAPEPATGPVAAAPSNEPLGAGGGSEPPTGTGGGGEPPEGKPKRYGPVDERSFAELNDVVAELNQGPFGEELQANLDQAAAAPATPRRTISKRAARAEAEPVQRAFRQTHGLTDPDVQAGHTQTVRHTVESGAPHAQVNNPAEFQQLHSRLTREAQGRRLPASRAIGASEAPNAGLNVDVTTPNPDVTQPGVTRTTTRHRAQEGLIDDAVARARARTGGRLTAEGQAAAGQEVLWRTEGAGFDQREVQIKRQSGLFDEQAAIERSPAVKARRARLAATSSADNVPAAAGGSAADAAGAATPLTAPPTSPEAVAPATPGADVQPAAGGTSPPAPASPSEPPPPAGEPSGPSRGGVGEPEPRISEIEQMRLETIGERRRVAGVRGLVESEYQDLPEERGQALRPREKVPGRSEVSDRVKASLRARARERFGKAMQEALRDESKHTPLTQETLKHLTPEQQAYVRRTGQMPKGFEFHHLLTIADFPEFGDLAESGLALPKDVHRQAGHGGDTTRPVEAATYVDPEAMDRPGYSIDPEARKYHRARLKDIAEGRAATPEARGGVDADLLAERRVKLRQLQSRRKPRPGDAAEIQRLQGEIPVLEKLIADARSKPPTPGGAPQAPGGAPTTPPTSPPSGSPEAGAAPSTTSGPGEVSLGVDPNTPTGAEPPPLPALSPKLPPPQAADVASASGPAAVAPSPPAVDVAAPSATTPGEAAPGAKEPPSGESATGEKTPATAAAAAKTVATALDPADTSVPPAAPATVAPPQASSAAPPLRETPAVKGERAAKAEPTSALASTPARPLPSGAPDAGASGEGGPGGASSAPAGAIPSGVPGTTPVGAQAALARPTGSQSGDGSVIERVNPHYQPPPGAPEDLVSLRNQIIDTLGARAQALQFAQLMGKQEAHHAANEKPIADLQRGNEEAISATEAHQRAIANRDEANRRKQEQEGKVHDKLDDYSTRAGKLTSLTVPLKGLARFTGLASSLPDEPDFVLRFKRGILKINGDSRRFLGQLDQMDQTVADQKSQQGARANAAQADAATIKQTDVKARESGEAFDSAKQTAEDFDQKNKERKEVAGTERKGAQQTAAILDRQATQKQAQAVSLAAAMQFWARGHHQARLDALAQTSKKLEAMGYRVTEVRER